jgi:hypothetical protein
MTKIEKYRRLKRNYLRIIKKLDELIKAEQQKAPYKKN